MKEDRRIDNEELEKVTGGTHGESDEIEYFIKSHFSEVKDGHWSVICKLVKRKVNIEIVENYNYSTPNHYYVGSRAFGNQISHDELMKKLRELVGE